MFYLVLGDRVFSDVVMPGSLADEATLRVRPWVHQAGVLHAISSISMKLGQFKGSTLKLKMTNWFMVWIFMVGDSPSNWFN